MNKKKVLKMIIPIVIILIIVFIGLWIFTPFGFFNLKLEGEYQIKITINGKELYATMENNTSSMAFKRMLSHGAKTVNMRDYENMEKVGMLWKGLPSNNEQITTEPGDIILFMGGSIVVYYNQNSWNFTKMGHINNVTQDELKEILGNGNVKMTFELVNDNDNNKSISNEKIEENEMQNIINENVNDSVNERRMNLTINNRKLTATLENNKSVEELIEKLKQNSITIDMHDYANMEKVGSLGFNLTRSDEQINTDYGDLILYQGNSFVIYYDTNSWNFTKLGHIDNISQEELKNILGNGNVEVTLSLEK